MFSSNVFEGGAGDFSGLGCSGLVVVRCSVCYVGEKLRVRWPASGGASFGFMGSLGAIGGVCQTNGGECRDGSGGVVIVRIECGRLVSSSSMVSAV